MFSKLLIANRGEIALRIHRAARDLGVRTVAVHSTADADALHARLADERVQIGPAPAALSYLNIPAILAAAEITNADAIHPGYGFLAENAHFAEVVREHRIAWVGPAPEHIRAMGDKVEAKRRAQALGLPLVPGSDGPVADPETALRVAATIGFPLLVKAAAGGGGRGMKVALVAEELPAALAQARSEAKAAFGDDTVYLEKYLGEPRHIEFQIFGDGQGRAVHLFERDCSLQRRHQKLLEEAPSPAIDAATRVEMGQLCARAMAEMGYAGAGTIEFLWEDGRFFFIEMNTRIQVEHPVTEMVTGTDLVAEQIRVAAGLPMQFTQTGLEAQGHAIECRILAEDPRSFVPSPGLVTFVHVPGGPGVRVDTALYDGWRVPPHYDSLIAKLIVHAPTREACLLRLERALDEFVIEGVKTTLPLFQALLREPDFRAGRYSIRWLEAWLAAQGTAHG